MANKVRTRSPLASPASRICATMEQHYYMAQTDEVYAANRRDIETFSRTARLAPRAEVIRIPVVVHVLFGQERENIGFDQIESQIEALNRDYRARNQDAADVPAPFKALVADTLIEFALAVRDPRGAATTGITRTQTSISLFPYDRFDREATAKLDRMIKHNEFGKAAWPRDDYLNIWTCSIEGGLLGYAQFPGGAAATDGVVINNTAFGTGGIANAPFDLGRTCVHEVGHYLNLLHIWGDDDLRCSGSDAVQDTPNQAGSNDSSVRKASFPHISCNNAPHGEMFMNYMDYVDDATMVMFSKGQLERMNATLSGPRRQLKLSRGLTPVGTERIALSQPFSNEIMASLPPGVEAGEKVERTFDGVSWV